MSARFIVNVACLLALFALALMVWSVLDPRPVPVMLAMSAGQVLGTLSLAAATVVVVRGLTREPEPRTSEPATAADIRPAS